MGFCSFRGIPGLGCFSRKKPSSPVELVRATRELLQTIDQWPAPLDGEKNEKMAQLMGYIRQMKSILYGSRENEPIPEACSQLTQEFLQDDTMRLCITCLPKLVLEVRKDITQVLANIQRQQVQSRLIACDYLEANKDLLDLLLSGYEDMFIALHYGSILRDCIRHQSIARFSSFSANNTHTQGQSSSLGGWLMDLYQDLNFEECLGEQFKICLGIGL
eukprot:c15776_g1_i1 orf=1-651(-)